MTEEHDLDNKIEKWLNEQGYPLEMSVASTLQKLGFRVVQSEYYNDPESGDARELDVVGFLQKDVSDVLLRFSLMIECKKSSDKPWLLFTSPNARIADPARIAQRAANAIGKSFLMQIAQQGEIQQSPLFSLPVRPAYGLTQAFTTGKDVCHSAVTSVSKAALAEVTEKERPSTSRLSALLRRKVCTILFPVVVVEGRLFEVYLDDKSKTIINETKNGVLLWRNSLVGMPHTIINIVTSADFDNFVKGALTSINIIFNLSDEEICGFMKNAVERASRTHVK